MAISARMQRHFGWLFLDAKKVRFEQGISAAAPDRFSKFDRAGKPTGLKMKIGGRYKISRRSDSQLRRVPLLGHGYLKGTTRDRAVGSWFPIVGRHRGIAAGMVAVFHVRHQPGLAMAGGILPARRRINDRRGTGKNRLCATHEAGQDSHPQGYSRGRSSLQDLQSCAHFYMHCTPSAAKTRQFHQEDFARYEAWELRLLRRIGHLSFAFSLCCFWPRRLGTWPWPGSRTCLHARTRLVVHGRRWRKTIPPRSLGDQRRERNDIENIWEALMTIPGQSNRIPVEESEKRKLRRLLDRYILRIRNSPAVS
jgi:hypothetical protein